MFSDIYNLGKNLVTGWFENKKAKQISKQKINEAKAQAEIKKINDNNTADNNLDALTIAEQKNSYKDEFVVLVFLLPFIGSFIPVVQDSVLIGWEYVSKAPTWYNYVIYAIVVSVLGLRRLFTNLLQKKFGG